MVTPNKRLMVFVLAVFAAAILMGCSAAGEDADGRTPTPVDPTPAPSVQAVDVIATPVSIGFDSNSTIRAAVYNSSGIGVGGVQVVFSLDQPSLAYVSPSIVTTDANGIAHTTLTSRNQQGNVSVTAAHGTVRSPACQVSIQTGISIGEVKLTADPLTILLGSTSAIRAEVLDATGAWVPNGTAVTFAVLTPTYGAMTSGSAYTNNGIATATFQSGNNQGQAVIAVSAGNITEQITVLVNETATASIEFVSAVPTLISIKGSGLNETSDIRFVVKDEHGNVKPNVGVTMILEGPGGGARINSDDNSPERINVASDSNGVARVILQSGTLPGPATILAEINDGGTLIRVRSSVVSIGGGKPSAGRFSVAATRLNLPALRINGVETDITAYLADRYGNYNVLPGTTVSFFTEPSLVIDTSDEVQFVADGRATVTARTQHPVNPPYPMSGGYVVVPFAWEQDLLNYVQARYNWSGENTPRDGLISVLVVTDGEEHFDDLRGTGDYEEGIDTFFDTQQEPFIDYNDRGYQNAGGADPPEIFLDVNGDGLWNSYNGEWDSNKKIFHNFKILITGEPFIEIFPETFNLPKGHSQQFTVLVADQNLNYPSQGTNIAFSADGGTVSGGPYEMDDSSFLPGIDGSMITHLRTIEHNALLINTNTGDPRVTIFKVEVSWEGKKKAISIVGTLQ